MGWALGMKIKDVAGLIRVTLPSTVKANLLNMQYAREEGGRQLYPLRRTATQAQTRRGCVRALSLEEN